MKAHWGTARIGRMLAERDTWECQMKETKPRAQAAPRDMRHLFRQSDADFFASSRNMGCMGRDVWHPPTDVY